VADPGLGFGKTVAHNLTLLARLPDIVRAAGVPVLVGPSRKGFIGVVGGAPGEPLPLELSIHNGTGERLEYWTGLPRVDFWIERQGRVVWRWSIARGGAWPDILLQDELAAGRTKHRRKTWHQEDCRGAPTELQPGRYVARALWSASLNPNGGGKWWSNPVEFEIR
jgi:hypothetical protein